MIWLALLCENTSQITSLHLYNHRRTNNGQQNTPDTTHHSVKISYHGVSTRTMIAQHNETGLSSPTTQYHFLHPTITSLRNDWVPLPKISYKSCLETAHEATSSSQTESCSVEIFNWKWDLNWIQLSTLTCMCYWWIFSFRKNSKEELRLYTTMCSCHEYGSMIIDIDKKQRDYQL